MVLNASRASPKEKTRSMTGRSAGLLDGPVHFHEVLARSDVDAPYLQHFVQDRRDREGLFAAGEHADLGYDAASTSSGQGLLEGACAADFDGEVHASAAGLRDRPAGPLGVIAIVVAGIEAQFGRPAQLVRAGRRADDPRAECFGELQREAGDAACALDEHGVAGLDVGGCDDSIPCGDAGAGQGGGLFEAEVLGEVLRRRSGRARSVARGCRRCRRRGRL